MPESLDPNVVNLAKAIRQTESGGDFKAKGKSGEYGAYQYTEPTWNAASQKYLGSQIKLSDATPEQQNEVTYKRLKEWKDQGRNPGQIASMWNAGEGEPDAYTGKFSNGQPATGTNKYNAKFDVPAYAKSVATAYQKIKAGGQATIDPSNPSSVKPPPSFLEQLAKTYSPESMWGDIKKYASTAVPVGLGIATLGASAGLAPFAAPGLSSLLGGGAVATGAQAATKPGIIGGLMAKGASFLKNLKAHPLEAILAVQGVESTVKDAYNAVSGGAQPQSAPQAPQGQSQSNIMQDLAQFNQGTGQSVAASKSLENLMSQSVSRTESGRNFLSSASGKQGLETASIYGYAPEADENGVIDSTGALQKLKKQQKEFAGMEKDVAGDGDGSALSAANYAGKYIGESYEFKNMTPNAKREAADYARKEIESYGALNQPMKLSAMIDARHQQYAATKGKYGQLTSAQIAGHKAAAAGFREAVKEASKNPELYDMIMKQEQGHINAEKLLKKMHNKKAMQNDQVWRQFLKGSARYAELYIGDKIGGPLGAVLGLMAGEHLNRKIDKKYGKTVFETAGVRAAMDTLKNTKPEVHRHIISKLKEVGINPDLSEPGESPEVPGSKVGMREDIEKNMEAMDKSKEGLIRLKNPTALHMRTAHDITGERKSPNKGLQQLYA
jgi:hypothetical protein